MALDGNTDETNGYNSVAKNGVVSNVNFIKSMVPPIGVVMPWLKTMTGMPTLPDGWVECNGQTLSDSDSPFDGETIPDLNNNDLFLRGNATSGGTGGADTSTLATTNLPAHTHTISTGTAGGSTGMITRTDVSAPSANQATGSTGSGTAFSILNAYYNVVYIMRIK